MFPRGQKHILGVIFAPWKDFEFSENLRFEPGRTLAMLNQLANLLGKLTAEVIEGSKNRPNVSSTV